MALEALASADLWHRKVQQHLRRAAIITLFEGGSPLESSDFHVENAHSRAFSGLKHGFLVRFRRAMDLDVTLPRRHWPLEALRKTFEEMQADSPVDLIARELLLSSLHPGGGK